MNTKRNENGGFLRLLYAGDCLELMKYIQPKSIDMIFVDFPWGITKAKWDKPIDLEHWWTEVKRILKPNGVVVAKSSFPYTIKLAESNKKWLRYEWIWEKSNATGHLNAKKIPLKAHENLLVFYQKLPTYNPQKTTGHPRKVSKKEHQSASKNSELYGEIKATGYDSTERYPRSVLKFASDKQKGATHSTQTPVALVEYMVRTYTNEGDVVLDTCAGSGTTGETCDNLNRQFILIEKDSENVKEIEERVNIIPVNHG